MITLNHVEPLVPRTYTCRDGTVVSYRHWDEGLVAGLTTTYSLDVLFSEKGAQAEQTLLIPIDDLYGVWFIPLVSSIDQLPKLERDMKQVAEQLINQYYRAPQGSGQTYSGISVEFKLTALTDGSGFNIATTANNVYVDQFMLANGKAATYSSVPYVAPSTPPPKGATMPWLSIISFILTFFISSKSGASKGQAALLATGAAAGTYYLADPANKDNVLGVTMGDSKATPGDPSVTSPSTPSTGTIGTLGSSLITGTAEVAKSWGPVGTVGALAAGTALLGGSSSKNNLLLWGALGLGAYLLLKD